MLEAATVKEPTLQQDPVDIGLQDRNSANGAQGKETLLILILQRYLFILIVILYNIVTLYYSIL